jgi:hypothetical protein
MVISSVVYLNALHNGFVDWDDGTYVLNNHFIRSLDYSFFRWITFSFHAGNWHPLTWLSHAMDYKIWGLNPMGHHLTNIALHGINSFLVTVISIRLLESRDRVSGTPVMTEYWRCFAGALTGLLFGVHPLHVESVAWVAERKDLLCALFFLLSINSYIHYVSNKVVVKPGENGRTFLRGTYLAGLIFFILALLSKPMAVSLPIVLLIIDWYPFERFRSFRGLLPVLPEKLPFILLSIGSSIVTFLAQKEGGAVIPMVTIPLSDRFLMAIKSLALYLGKLILPLNLLPFYTYPKHVAPLSFPYLSAFVTVLAIVLICFVFARKYRLLPAVFGFYFVTLIPVLGIVQVGNQAMADRYSYLPSIGPFLLAGVALAWLGVSMQGIERLRLIAPVFSGGLVVVVVVVLGAITWRQTAVWKNSITLWSYVIEKNHENENNAVKFSFAYNNRGVAYHEKQRLDEAIADYSRGILLDPADGDIYNNRAIAYAAKKEYELALADNRKAFQLNPNNGGVLYNIACIYALKKEPDQACDWLKKSIDHGYADWENIRHDRDLENIRSMSCYQSIMAGK